MKIDQAMLTLNAAHEYTRVREVSYQPVPVFGQLFQTQVTAAPAEGSLPDAAENERLKRVTLIAALLTRILAMLAGRQEGLANGVPTAPREEGRVARAGGEAGSEWTISWQAQKIETLREHESSDFTAHGLVLTADGRSLDFSLDLSMCRDYFCVDQQRVSSTLKLRDPLVVNFAGNAVQLAGKRFAFDLDQDGSDDQLYGLGRGSAYLAIDHDSNGRINDGGELFGSVSGNGFADLAQFDDDGNRWIDEADAAFAKLRLWSGEPGPQTLRTLAEQGVGALYLGAVATPFSVTDSANRTLAQIRASGLFLHENGAVGSLQQVDLAG